MIKIRFAFISPQRLLIVLTASPPSQYFKSVGSRCNWPPSMTSSWHKPAFTTTHRGGKCTGWIVESPLSSPTAWSLSYHTLLCTVHWQCPKLLSSLESLQVQLQANGPLLKREDQTIYFFLMMDCPEISIKYSQRWKSQRPKPKLVPYDDHHD